MPTRSKAKDGQTSMDAAEETRQGIDWEKLRQETPHEALEWKPKTLSAEKQKAQALAYVSAPYVMDLLDQACGPDGWQFETPTQADGPAGWVRGRLTLHIGDGETRVYENYGYPSRVAYHKTDKEVVSYDDEPLKSAATDALKRCAYLVGVARDLREFEPIWVSAKITSKDGRKYFERWTEDPLKVWLAQKNGEKPAAASPSGPTLSDIIKLAKEKWGDGSLNKLRSWLAEQSEGAIKHEREIPKASLGDIYTALVDYEVEADAA